MLADYIAHGTHEEGGAARAELRPRRRDPHLQHAARQPGRPARSAIRCAARRPSSAGCSRRRVGRVGLAMTARSPAGRMTMMDGSHLFPMEKPAGHRGGDRSGRCGALKAARPTPLSPWAPTRAFSARAATCWHADIPQAMAFQAPSLALLATEPCAPPSSSFPPSSANTRTVDGDGHPVIVYPGLGAGALTTSQLRAHLHTCNFEASRLGTGREQRPRRRLGHLAARPGRTGAANCKPFTGAA